MNWIDEGIFLNGRPFGESASVVTILTSSHGRQAGFVRGGSSRKFRAILQTGNLVQCAWRGRLQENLGTFTIELIHPIAATLLNNGMGLAGLSSACALVEAFLPEREANAAIFLGLRTLLKALYGLPISGRLWAKCLAKHLLSEDWTECLESPGIWKKSVRDNNGNYIDIFISVYVVSICCLQND